MIAIADDRDNRGVDHYILHTGQHSSHEMDWGLM